jgi:hypothetical protein
LKFFYINSNNLKGRSDFSTGLFHTLSVLLNMGIELVYSLAFCRLGEPRGWHIRQTPIIIVVNNDYNWCETL